MVPVWWWNAERVPCGGQSTLDSANYPFLRCEQRGDLTRRPESTGNGIDRQQNLRQQPIRLRLFARVS